MSLYFIKVTKQKPWNWIFVFQKIVTNSLWTQEKQVTLLVLHPYPWWSGNVSKARFGLEGNLWKNELLYLEENLKSFLSHKNSISHYLEYITEGLAGMKRQDFRNHSISKLAALLWNFLLREGLRCPYAQKSVWHNIKIHVSVM